MIHATDGHIPFRVLADRRDGTLAPSRAAGVEAHLATGCAQCVARDGNLRRIVTAVAAGALETPPAAADRRVVALFPKVAAAFRRTADGSSRERTLVGTLVSDRRFDAAFDAEFATSYALRAADDGARRLLWALGSYEVDASVVGRGATADVLGQVVPLDDAPDAQLSGEVHAVRGRRAVQSSSIETDGRFTFRGLAPGAYVFEGAVDGRPFILPLVVLE